MLKRRPAVVSLLLLVITGYCRAEEINYTPPRADEPIARSLSLAQAARSLDASAVWWQQTHDCCHCHANMMYLVARPALDGVVERDRKVRDFFEYLVLDRWEKRGLRYEPEALVVAVPLAFDDHRTTGKLHPATRKALDRMVSLQRPEGNWTLKTAGGGRQEVAGERKAFLRGFEQTMFAAMGIAIAPEDYAKTKAASAALDRIRNYAKAHPPHTPHQKGMAVWASHHVEGLLDATQRAEAVNDLLRLQGADGGWATENLVAGSSSFEAVKVAKERGSDGYATGFVIFVARQGGVSASDERLQRGLEWLKANQRESGRWFNPSLNNRPNHVLSNSGTAYAILALEACGQVPKQSPK
jgi:squalene-hopene/tetraprenyl-beta-curcumene cyclase